MTVIDIRPCGPKSKFLAAALLPFQSFLSAAQIEQWCREANYSWRERIWSPAVTLLSCVWQHAQACRVSVRDVEDAHAAFLGEVAVSPRDGRDFCNARRRLPEKVFKKAVRYTGALASKLASLRFKDLPVCFADGTTVRLANSSANAKAFGRSKTVAGPSRTPLMRLVLLACAGCGAILSSALGSYDTSEQALFMQLLDALPAAGLLVADRAFSTFLNFCLLRQSGCHMLSRMRDDRKARRVKRLGRNDALHCWSRPRPVHTYYPELIAECPEEILVRVLSQMFTRKGYRPLMLTLATTLLDPVRYPARELAELYLRRWRMETNLRTLKTDLELARLSCKTADIVRKEVHATLLAHNCVIVFMGKSGEAPELLSPTRVRRIVAHYAGHMAFAPTVCLPEHFNCMLSLIRTALQMPQERPPEPRAILQTHTTFPLLRTTRHEWRRRYLVA